MKAILMLEDGTVFEGEPIGKEGIAAGPIFFDTRVVGYQEVMTDPANADKILLLTYPLIGNYGINEKFNESETARVKGLVIKEKSKTYSNWQAKSSLEDFLEQEGIVGITEVDTRTLAVHLRDNGEMLAAISTNGKGRQEVLDQIKRLKQNKKQSLIKEISIKKPKVIAGNTKTKIGILDLGIPQGLITQLKNLGVEIIVLPYDTSAEKILKSQLKGLILSSGPEEDIAQEQILPILKNIIGKIPVLGIAVGAHLVAKALGAATKKMILGHHGVNYPIKSPDSFKGHITVQNHSWVVELDSLKKIKDMHITALNLNDGTVEAFESKKHKVVAVQYCLTSPGFDEANATLIKFLQFVKGKK